MCARAVYLSGPDMIVKMGILQGDDKRDLKKGGEEGRGVDSLSPV